MSEDIKDFVERYPTYLEALDQIDKLQQQLDEKDKETINNPLISQQQVIIDSLNRQLDEIKTFQELDLEQSLILDNYKIKKLNKIYLYKLKKLAKSDDTEQAHIEADDILIELLNKLGLSKIAKTYDDVDKWYS